MNTDCQFPEVGPVTGYGHGCRCRRCKDGKYNAVREWRAAARRRDPEGWKARQSAQVYAWRHRDDPTEGIRCCLCLDRGLILDVTTAVAHLRSHEWVAA